MIRAIFWDNDGVLVDTERLYFIATRQVLARVGVELSQEQFREFFPRQGIGAWHLAEARGATEHDIERLRLERNALYGDLLDHSDIVIDGIEAVLEALGGRYVMGIVTSSRREHLDRMHRRTGLLRFFDFVLASGDYPRHKPEPDPYVAAVARSGFDRADCAAVEDSARGVASAAAAGIRCYAVPTELTSGSDFQGAHKVLASASELPGELTR